MGKIPPEAIGSYYISTIVYLDVELHQRDNILKLVFGTQPVLCLFISRHDSIYLVCFWIHFRSLNKMRYLCPILLSEWFNCAGNSRIMEMNVMKVSLLDVFTVNCVFASIIFTLTSIIAAIDQQK